MYYSNSPEETKSIAVDLATKVAPGAILAFFGDLGTGKTTFIRYLAEELATVHPDSVSSPTFQYLNIYNGPVTVYHFDLYRLKDSHDFIQMGFDDVLSAGGVCCIEWAERIEDILPANTLRISITHTDDGKRKINLGSAVQDAKAMQDLESESPLMGAEHSQKVKAAPIKGDYGSRGCVDLASSTAESRLTI